MYSDLKKFDQDDHYKPILRSIAENSNATPPINSHINVCLGKEWYRYPSSFFLPSSKRYRMRFIKSEFRGQLPKLYEDDDKMNPSKGLKTRIIYDDFNDMNKEQPSRYTSPENCHYLIDTYQNHTSAREPNFSDNKKDWTVLSSRSMLDLAHSPFIFRSFYLPSFSEKTNTYVKYQLLRNNNLFAK